MLQIVGVVAAFAILGSSYVISIYRYCCCTIMLLCWYVMLCVHFVRSCLLIYTFIFVALASFNVFFSQKSADSYTLFGSPDSHAFLSIFSVGFNINFFLVRLSS